MEIIIILLLIIVVAEASYLVAVNTKKIAYRDGVRPIFVDTSVLIDGRIIAVAKSGFVIGRLSIPRSVIGELQFLADNADPEKRSRARHGLDVVSELQAMPDVDVEIFPDGSKAEEGVDERLLKLAKQYNGVVCTIDYNLNKVARVENITVLNVNDLAMGLRMAYLPGEKILLELTQKGQDDHQAVGHLTDGTMVVVENANNLINKTVEIEFIRSLQTAAGKMMFAKLVDKNANTIVNKKPVGTKKVKSVKNVKKTNRERPIEPKKVGVKPNTDRNSGPKNKPKISSTTNQSRRKKQSNRNKSGQNEQNLIDLLNNQ